MNKDIFNLGKKNGTAGATGASGAERIARVNRKDIAIIGMGGRWPGANDLRQFWNNLAAGKDSIALFPAGRIAEVNRYLQVIGEAALPPDMFKEKGFLDHIDKFDNKFFNISHKEACLMNPSHRLFLQAVWHALQDAACPPAALQGSRTGVYVGLTERHEGYYNLVKEMEPELSGMAHPGNVASILASRISYLLDLKGPGILIDTACSSSLVAVHTACQALRSGEIDMAIAGGISVNWLPLRSPAGAGIGIESKIGRARTFDDESDGTVGGEGVAAILLKPYADAVRDGDPVLAIIKGSAVNQDGKSIGITAPSVLAQVAVIESAWQHAGIDPATLSYMEAHGTATNLGDPIEIEAITRAFRRYTSRRQLCAIGAVKTNIGHLDAAAGITGLVKTVLSLQHKQLPPLVHFERPNRKIAFEDSPVYINDELCDWVTEEGIPRRCGVSSFGISGTNCHLVLEEAPVRERRPVGNEKPLLLCLSARTETDLAVLAKDTLDYLRGLPEYNPGDVCFTLAVGREQMKCRRVAEVRDRAQLQQQLQEWCNGGGADAEDVDWAAYYRESNFFKISLPGYPFELKRCWVTYPDTTQTIHMHTEQKIIAEVTAPAAPAASAASPSPSPSPVLDQLKQVIAKVFEIADSEIDTTASFLEMGLDSVSIIQVKQLVKSKYQVDISIDALFNEASSLDKLAEYVNRLSPMMPAAPVVVPATVTSAAVASATVASAAVAPANNIEALVQQQLQIMADQLRLLGQPAAIPAAAPVAVTLALPAIKPIAMPVPVNFQWTSTAFDDLGPEPKKNLEAFIKAFNKKTALSKQLAQQARTHFANNRNTAHYNKNLKEMAYPILMQEAKGVRVKDIDGNEYIDMSMGFGVFLLGYNHPVIEDAIRGQAGNFFLGPMSALPGEVAQLLHELTGVDRVAFYNSGTEAVMVALRLARAARGRTKVVIFAGTYHGTYDGVLAQRDLFSTTYGAIPKGAGIPDKMVGDVVMLEYGSPDSIAAIRAQADEIAAVLVEPVQSRRPEFQPVEFLQQLRAVTEEQGIVLVFDEIISGFRIHPGGCQQHFGVKADLVTYGKISGGGLPLGIVAGKSSLMHGIDGGADWKYGDDSHPVFDHRKVFVAGTFCHHPLAMASARAILTYLKEQGPALQQGLNRRVDAMAAELNAFFQAEGMPIQLVNFGSLFQFRAGMELSLFYLYLAYKGIYVWEGMTLFLSTAHTDEDVAAFVRAVKETIREMRANGFLTDVGRVAPAVPGAPAVAVGAAAAAKTGEPIPFTFEQRRLWFKASANAQTNIAFNAHREWRIDELTGPGALGKVLRKLVQRHEILQTVRTDGRNLYLDVDLQPKVELVDFSDLTEAEAEVKAAAWTNNYIYTPFDLSKGCLFRAAVIWLPGGRSCVLFTIHSLIADGWSLNLLADQLMELYLAERGGTVSGEPPAPSFRLYSAWQAAQQDSEESTAAAAFWRQRLEKKVPAAILPVAGKEHIDPSGEKALNGWVFLLTKANTESLKKFAQKNGVSLFMLLLGCFENFLSRIGGKPGVVIGIPASGQLLMNETGIVGQCNQLTPYLHEVDGGLDAMAFLNDLRTNWLSFYKYQRFSCLDLLVREGLEAAYPDPKVVFNMDPPVNGVAGHEEAGDCILAKPGENKYDFFLNAIEVGGGLRLHFQFNPKLYPSGMVKGWIDTFGQMLYRLVEHPTKPIGGLPLTGMLTYNDVENSGKELEPAEPASFTVLTTPTFKPEHADPVEASIKDLFHKLFPAAGALSGEHNFFELGGNSIQCIQLLSWIYKEWGVQLDMPQLFEHPSIKQIAGLIRKGGYGEFQNIPRLAEAEDYEASQAQRRLWIINQNDSESLAFNMSNAYMLPGGLDKAALGKAFTALIARHEILRTTFISRDGEIRQKVHAPGALPFVLTMADLSGMADDELRAEEIAIRDRNTPFDLETGPLLRVSILEMRENRCILILTIHHIISDGWSKKILTNEVLSLYNSFVHGLPDELPELSIQYKDYTRWQNLQIGEEAGTNARNYWLQQFSGELPVLELPADYPRPLVRTQNGANKATLLSAGLLKRVAAVANRNGVTLFTVLFAATKAFLHKLSGQSDIIIGLPTSGRDHPDTEQLIGLFVHTLPVRTVFNAEDRFDDFLKEVKGNMMDAFRYQIYPVNKLIEELNISWEISRRPLFDVMVNNWLDMQSSPGEEEQEGLGGDRFTVARNNSMFDLSFTFIGMPGDTQELNLNYNTDIYSAGRIARMLEQFVVFLDDIATDSSRPITALSYLPETETKRLLDFAGNGLANPPAMDIVSLFESVVSRYGAQPALRAGDRELTYRRLNDEANRLARCLVNEYGIASGVRVGILADRSEWMIIAVLAVLKAGAAYVPIDSSSGADRIGYLLEDSGVTTLLTDGPCPVTLPEGIVTLDLRDYRPAKDYGSGNLPKKPATDDIAYIIYTSGSTGRPKGVQISHRPLLGLWEGIGNAYGLDRFPIRLLQVASFSFDVFFEDLLRSLLRGGVTVLCPSDLRYDLPGLHELIEKEKITILESTPGLMLPLLDYLHEEGKGRGSLEVVIMGSDSLLVEDYRRVQARFGASGLRLFNSYGTTESCIDASYYEGTGEELRPVGYMPVGRPLPNMRLYVLDANQRLCGIGVRGEIAIGGYGVGQGYWKREELTSEKFIANPFVPGEILYRTGDIGSWTDSGILDYHGRGDHQVKIRGYRVEPGEVESVLQGFAGLKEAVVLAQDMGRGDWQLIGYVVWKEGEDENGLREFCRQKLPLYMHPSQYIALDKLPLSANGKIDRLQLPKAVVKAEVKYEGARSDKEEALIKIWEEVLGRENIGIRDNFFTLGGHSLKGIKAIWRIRKEMGVNISFPDIFTHPSIADLAELITRRAEIAEQTVQLTEIASQPRYELSHGQLRMWIIAQMEEGRSAYNMCSSFELMDTIDEDTLSRSFEQLIQRHEILRTVFVTDHEGVWQQVRNVQNSGFRVLVMDLTGFSRDEQQATLNKLSAAEVLYKFDLGKGPLLRVHLLRMSEEFSVLLLNMHHIISDGWSIDIMMEELHKTYEGIRSGKPFLPEPLRIQYKEYASWQNKLLKSDDIVPHRRYWLDCFGGDLPVLNLPADFTRPAVRTYRGATVRKIMSRADTHQLQRRQQAEPDKSMYMLLLSCVYTLLYRYTGQEDITVGILVAGREHDDLMGQVGLYVNTLPLRTSFDGKDNLPALLGKVQDTVLGAFENQVYPLDMLVEDLDLAGDRSRSPLFDVLVTYKKDGKDENLPEAEESTDRLAEEEAQMNDVQREDSNISKFDLSVSFREDPDNLYMSINYSTDLYTEQRISTMLGHLEQVIRLAARNSQEPLAALPYLTVKEQQLLQAFNDTDKVFPEGQTIPGLFEAQVLRTPEAIAVEQEGQTVTYDELNRAANRLAAYLTRQYQLGPGAVAGVLMERTISMVVTLLAILKTGAAYVPIDVEYPEERVKYITGDSQPLIVLTDALIAEALTAISDSDNREVTIDAGGLAYLIYTSGSTGRPKGVRLTHRNAIAFIDWCAREFGGAPFRTVIALTSYCFDLSIFELFYTLSAGKKMLLLKSVVDAKKTIEMVPDLLLNTVPSVADSLIKLGTDFTHLRLLNLAGEPVPRSIKDHFRDTGVVVRNLYGPSEDTTYSTCYVFDDENDDILIGKPIANTRIYILDVNRQLVPVGLPGEIHISGAGLALGYLGQDKLTAEKFVDNPFEPGQRMYRTGDVGQWTKKGDILFLGRNDDQVKIRGYRIEPGEIQEVIQGCPDVKQALVMAVPMGSGEKELAAYIVWAGEASETLLQEYLRGKLPVYMQPAFIIGLDAMPLNSNGKIDKKALPKPAANAPVKAEEWKGTVTEKKIAAIWEEILQRKDIGLNDNFFEAGGHSLKGMRVLARINAVFGVKFTLKDIFKKPTVRQLAEAITAFGLTTAGETKTIKLQEVII
jgi:amino acid adenylation domain-containing protein